jgi:hypothetical protein
MNRTRTADAWVLDVPLAVEQCAAALARSAADVRGTRLPAALARAGVSSVQVRPRSPGESRRLRVGVNGLELRAGGWLTPHLVGAVTIRAAPGEPAASRVEIRFGVDPRAAAVAPLVAGWVGALTVPGGGRWVLALAAPAVAVVFAAAAAWQAHDTTERYGPGIADILEAALTAPRSGAAI